MKFFKPWEPYNSKYPDGFSLVESFINLYTYVNELVSGLNNKTDVSGDHKGSWQGLSKPTLSEEGMKATVEKINEVELPDIKENLTLLNAKLELNIKDFGAKGDGETDDTNAFLKAFDYIREKQIDYQYSQGTILKIPFGTYIINKGFDVDVNVGIIGEGQIKPPSYKIFGANAYQQDMSPNCTTIKYNEPKNNMTMFRPVWGKEELEENRYHKDFYLENIMLDGNDGIVNSQVSPTAKGTKDLIINFIGKNSNGVDLTNVRYLRGSNNLFITGFSGYGLKTYHWQQHNNPIINLCSIGIISGGDGGIMSPYVAFCKKGIQIGDVNLLGATDRIIDVRVEWCEEYGIEVINGGNNRISGFIDRCGYSGYCQKEDGWNMNVDLTIQRCGCVWRGGVPSDLTTKELKQQGSNVYVNNIRGGNFRFTHIKGGSRDTSESDNYKSPVLAASYIGGTNFVTSENTMGFSEAFYSDYYIEGNSKYSIISNDFIMNSKGISIDKNTNKLYIDLYDQYRFRPPINWGKPSDSTGENGDIMFDSQGGVMYYKGGDVWKSI